MQEEEEENPLQRLRFLTLSVSSIDGSKWRGRRRTLDSLMRMDEMDVVFLQETQHGGDAKMPLSYAKGFKEHTGVAGSL